MKYVWKCDYCTATFLVKEEADEHEKKCGHNPANKVKDKMIFRLAMLYHELQDIIAASIIRTGVQDLDRLRQEIDRADEANCSFAVYERKRQIENCLLRAKSVQRKREGLKTTQFEDMEKHYPELCEAITKTLQRQAWNEWE